MTSSRRGRHLLAGIAGTALAALALSSCTDADDPSDSDEGTSGGGSFPVTVEDSTGSVTIDALPEKIVVLEQYEVLDVIDHLELQSHVLAFSMPELVDTPNYLPDEYHKGGDKYEEDLVGDAPGTPNAEAVAALDPDVIFAPSYYTDEDVEMLSAIAPVVRNSSGDDTNTDEYVEAAFIALGSGKEESEGFLAEGNQILTDFKDQELDGKTFTLDYFAASEEGLSSPNFGSFPYFDTIFERGYMSGAAEESGELQELSWENVKLLESNDIMVVAGIDPAEPKKLLDANPFFSEFPATQNDLVLYQFDPSLEMSLSNPATPRGAQHFVDHFGAEIKQRLETAGVLD